MLKVSKPTISAEETMLVSAKEDRIHTIYDFLSRPVVLVATQYQVGDAPNTPITGASVLFPDAIWTHPVWAEKMKGFRYWRATLNFQLQINASPFDIGRVWMFWSPFDTDRGDLKPVYSRTNVTGYPGVECDIGNKMTVEFKVPYVSPFTHIDQRNPFSQPYGALRVYVLNEYNSSNETAVDLTIYCWMSDIDLAIPTSIVTFPTVYSKQSGKEAQVKSKTGLITGGARLVGEAARMFANSPVIGEVAKDVGWLADAAGGAANLLGFSKPQDLEIPTVVQNVPAKGYTHTDGVDVSVVLGAKPDNEVKASYGVFGTKEDEMNFSYIISKPNWIERFPWSFTDAAKTNLLYSLPITAGICGTDVPPTMTPGSFYTPTHLAKIASGFRYWRGGVSIRLSAVKNEHYSGRLLIVYFPGFATTDVQTYDGTDISMCHQWIWDIKDDADLQLTVPYNSNTQFKRVRLFANNDTTERDLLGPDVITGVLGIYVENRLRGPATVPDTIYIHVWVHGASDMVFAVPDQVKYTDLYAPVAAAQLPVVTGFQTQRPCRIKTISKKPYRAQMLKVEPTFDVNHRDMGKQNPEGSAMLESRAIDSINPELYCTGEIHNNLRPLTRRFGIDYSWSSPTTSSQITLDPAYFWSNSILFSRNCLNYWCRLFVFYRGSMRYKIFSTRSTVPAGARPLMIVSSSALRDSSPLPYGTAPSDATDYEGGRFQHYQFVDLNPIVEVVCPYYSNVPIQLISKTYIQTLHDRMIYKSFTSDDNSVAGSNGSVFKAAGDDFSFGYLVGAPLVVASGQA
jgi:hypothetical protein